LSRQEDVEQENKLGKEVEDNTEDPQLDQGQPSTTTNDCDEGSVSHVSDSGAGLYLSNPEHEYIYIYIY